MIRLMLSAFQSITPAQLSVSQIMSPSENFVKDALPSAITKFQANHRQRGRVHTAIPTPVIPTPVISTPAIPTPAIPNPNPIPNPSPSPNPNPKPIVSIASVGKAGAPQRGRSLNTQGCEN